MGYQWFLIIYFILSWNKTYIRLMKYLKAIECSNCAISIHAAFSVNRSILWIDVMYSVKNYNWIIIIILKKQLFNRKEDNIIFITLSVNFCTLYNYRICILHKHIQIRQRSTIGHIFVYVHSVTDLVECRWYIIHVSNGYGQGSYSWSFRPDS